MHHWYKIADARIVDPTASLLSLARWFTDLVAYLVDDVLDMKRSFAGKEVTSEDLQDQSKSHRLYTHTSPPPPSPHVNSKSTDTKTSNPSNP